MNTLAWLDESFSLRLAATLLHFVWQGLAVALIVVATGWLLKRAAAQVRYSINVAVMLVLVACLPVTFAWVDVPQPVAESDGTRSPMTLQPSDSNRLADGAIAMLDGPGVLAAESDLALSPMRDTDPPKSEAETVDAEASRAKPVVQIPSETKPAFSWLHPIAPYLTLIYFAGVILMLVRLAKALWGGQNLRRAAIPVEDQNLLAMIERQAQRIGMKVAPAVALCERISIPIVVGVVKPMILLPVALASGLSPDQLQALVTHELAHIRRFDLLVNLLQRLIEAVLFFHPAVWFISRRVSIERENAADDMVLAAGWQRANYADALVRMAELSSSLRQTRIANQATALAATGTNSSDFKRRVLRLLENTEPPNLRLTRGGILTMVLVSASLLVTPVIVQTWADNHERQVSNLSESGDEAVVQTKSGGSRSEDVRGQETRARQAGDGAYEKKPKKLGTLTGRFFFDGEPPKPEKLVPPPARRPPFNATNRPNGGWLDWHRFRDLGLTDQSLIVGKEGGIKNILIWIRSRDVPVAPRTRPVEKPVLRMKDGQFQPRVLAFQVPQTLVLKNESTHLTNFHWQPIHNEPFNVVVASKHSREVTITKPEFFARFLNNDCQPWTNSWLFPCAHPYFAVTAADGTFRIENLPPGEWEFQVWHERAGYVQRDNWPKGRFTLKIEAGKNDLGVIKLPAALFDEKDAGERREKREQRDRRELNTQRSGDGRDFEKGRSVDQAPSRPIDRLNVKGFSELHSAAIRGDVQRVKSLLRSQANVNVRQGKFKGTPLQYAAHRGHVEVVRILLDAGAKIDATDTIGRTPLMWAAQAGHTDVVRTLLKRKSKVNAKTKTGWTALRYARKAGDGEIVQLLIDYGSDEQEDEKRDEQRDHRDSAAARRSEKADDPASPPQDWFRAAPFPGIGFTAPTEDGQRRLFIILACSKPVQDEIHAAELQLEMLSRLYQSFVNDERKIFKIYGGLSLAERRRRADELKAKKVKLSKETHQRVHAALTEKQRKRIEQIVFQRYRHAVFFYPKLAPELKLTEEQRDRLRAKLHEHLKRVKDDLKAGGPRTFGNESYRRFWNEDVYHVLTEQQRKKFQELRGRPIGEETEPAKGDRPASRVPSQSTKVEFRLAETKAAKGLIEAVIVGTEEKIYLLEAAVATNKDIAGARVSSDPQGKPVVHIDFTRDGAKKIAEATEQHRGKRLAVVVDGKVISAPIIRGTISSSAVITGQFSKEEAERIVDTLVRASENKREKQDSPAAPQADSKAKEPRSARPSGDKHSDVAQLRKQLERIRALETAAEKETKQPEKRLDLLRRAAASYEQFFIKHRSQLAGLYARLYQAGCLQKRGDDEEAVRIYEELLNLPDGPTSIRNLKAKVRELRGD